MALFLTKKELRSKRFVESEMFTRICPETQTLSIEYQEWSIGTYISRDIENGVELGIRSSRTLFSAISPFTLSLYNMLIPKFFLMGEPKKVSFEMKIKTEEEGDVFAISRLTDDIFLPCDFNQSFKIIVKPVVHFKSFHQVVERRGSDYYERNIRIV